MGDDTNEGPAPTCRCGWDGAGQHPCHRCLSRPGEPRWVVTGPAILAGVQIKLDTYQTYACPQCWKEYKEFVSKHSEPSGST